eukprot:scaffold2053_cov106-Skeletonema_dohrnii-CCMP3373.AAC.12
MAASTKASAASSEQSSVQPSATLIEALHHKLCDPSIVPEFEQCRSPHVTQRLITPRWILKDSAAEKLAGADSKAVGGSSSNEHESAPKSDTNNHDNGKETNKNNEPKFNTRPKRTYLDIRTQQNTTFANEQYQRCQKKLAALSSTSPKSVEAINVNKLQIKKVIDSIQNHLNEGLAACPNHEGLVQVESEVRGWLDRLNGVVVVGNGFNNGLASSAVVDTARVATGAEERTKNKNAIIDLTQTSPHQTVVKRKGGEGRAQAAMDDALVEKMFLQGETDNGGDSKNNDDAVDANQLKWVPPASRVDENADQHMRRKEGASDSDSYHGRKRSRHSHRRRSSRYQSRSRSRSTEREDRRKGERRHRHRRRDDDRKRKKRHHRSRSRSMSRGSVSSAAASLASRSTSRDRSSKRRHRRDRHSRHKRRYKSKSRRKERRKSSRRHRSRRERSRSVSSSSCPSTAGADGIKGRFEPPQLAQQVQKETEEGRPVQREDMDGLVPQPNDNGALGEIMQSGD